ncbi:MAG: fused MFS/spermidine synthase [Sedimentisphaerales bacterium]|nr:fused MFS/spermidine synthase [Sedimentisphaerales bacterium]
MSKIHTGQNKPIAPVMLGSTVFLASVCLMMLELSAGRMAARHLGSSLYTWTAVIGVVLSGMTIGNFIGGRIADRSANKKSIGILLSVASITCVGAIVLSNRFGAWTVLWQLSWPMYVLLYVSTVLMLPSIFLGVISPVIAKAALEHKTSKGRTIGTIYACGAAGSIAGTFLAGFWLIPALGTTGVIWASALSLLAAGLIYCPWHRAIVLWSGIFIILLFIGTATSPWAARTGAELSLREEPDPNVVFEDETHYCHILVRRESDRPEKRAFFQDKLKHSEMIMNDINNLQYDYARIYAAAMVQSGRDINDTATLTIGGGGFVFPRYLKKRWPLCRVDVAEIDPDVTRAVIEAFGMPKDHGINIFTMDGRNVIDGILARKQMGEVVNRYDFIYGDAYDHFCVPYQLVTRQFNEKLAQILKDDGFYMLNLIDFYESGLVIGSVLKTLEQTFKYVCVLSTKYEYYNRNTFVLIASKQPIDIEKIVGELERDYNSVWLLSPEETQTLKNKPGSIVLTDNYAPIDNLAAPIASQEGRVIASQFYIAEALTYSRVGQSGAAVDLYMKAIRTYPPLTLKTYYSIGEDLLINREFQETVYICDMALQYYARPHIKNDVSEIFFNKGIALKALGRAQEAKIQLKRAIDGFKRRLQKEPKSVDILSNLGIALAETGDFAQAAGYFERSIKIAPLNPRYRFMQAEALIAQKDYAGAQAAIKDAIDAMRRAGNQDAAAGLQQLLGRVAYETP